MNQILKHNTSFQPAMWMEKCFMNVFYTAKPNGEPEEQKKKGRFCTFYAKDWLNDEEFEKLFSAKWNPEGKFTPVKK